MVSHVRMSIKHIIKVMTNVTEAKNFIVDKNIHQFTYSSFGSKILIPNLECQTASFGTSAINMITIHMDESKV